MSDVDVIRKLLDTTHTAEVSHWTDSDLRQFLSSHGLSGDGSRSEAERRADELLDALYTNMQLHSAVRINGLDPREHPDFTVPVSPVAPDCTPLAGPVQRAFKASFNAEQLVKNLPGSGGPGLGGSSGTDPELDMRLKLGILFQGCDANIRSFTFLVPTEGIGKMNDALEILIDRVASVDGTAVLVARFLHLADARLTQQRLKDLDHHLQQVKSPPFQSTRLTSRQMQCLCKLLESNRSKLKKTFTKQMEKRWNTSGFEWRASVLTPLESAATTFCTARTVKSTLKKDMQCTLCRKSGADLDAVGQKLQCCQQCKAVWYCSKECQKLDWKGHKKICKVPEVSVAPHGVTLRVGDRVVVHGLIEDGHLNGCEGMLRKFLDESDCWAVDLDAGVKHLKIENLQQCVGQAVPQNRFLRVSPSLDYEPPELFKDLPNVLVPIEANTGQHLMLNGEVVYPNRLRSNVHESKVFVVKCQLMQNESQGKETMLIYDQIRHVLLSMFPTESGARSLAYNSLRAMILDKGAQVNMALKMYLHAQRHGPTVRIFMSRFPAQQQPF